MSAELLTDPAAERAVIGAGLSLEADDPLFRDLPAEAFGSRDHRALWSTLTSLAAEGTDPMPEAVKGRLRARQNGRGDELAAMVDPLMDRYAFEPPSYHADVVRDRAVRRALAEAAAGIRERASDLSLPVSDLVDSAERAVFSVAERRTSHHPQPVKAYLMGVMSLIESGGYRGTPTGFPDLDGALTGGGLMAGQLVCIAGATSMGKTALALGIASNMAIDSGTPVAYFSIEMTEQQNTMRLLAMEARADLKGMAEGDVHGHDMQNLVKAAGHLNAAPLLLHAGARTLPAIRAEARRLKAEHPELAAVFVDHIHDMGHPAESRREQMGAIARGLKDIGMELGVAVVAVAQLRRIGDRKDLRPRLSDLKESGDIENSTDVVLLVHRPEYFLSDEQAREQGVAGIAELIVGKQRNGPTPILDLTWRKHCARFDSHEVDR